MSLLGVAAPFASPALAQEAAPSAETVTESEIDAFVVAYRNVVAIDQEYAQQMSEAQDEATQQALRNEAQTRMTQAVAETPGIDVDRYVEILTLAQADPELGAEISQQLEQ